MTGRQEAVKAQRALPYSPVATGVGIMWIVRLALRRPYTFIVMAIVIMIMGAFPSFRTPKDIFPNINIPVVSVLWNYAGLSPEEMANRIVVFHERSLTLRSE